jgi:hypothetical protein
MSGCLRRPGLTVVTLCACWAAIAGCGGASSSSKTRVSTNPNTPASPSATTGAAQTGAAPVARAPAEERHSLAGVRSCIQGLGYSMTEKPPVGNETGSLFVTVDPNRGAVYNIAFWHSASEAQAFARQFRPANMQRVFGKITIDDGDNLDPPAEKRLDACLH